jgi:hypothetical protein
MPDAPEPAQARGAYRRAEVESGDRSNRDFGCEIHHRAFQGQSGRFLEASWMATAFLEALNGSDSTPKDHALDWKAFAHIGKVRPARPGTVRSKIIFLGETL